MIYETKRPKKILLFIKKVVNCFKTSVSKSLDSTVLKWCIHNSNSTCTRQISYLGRAVNVNAYDFGINNVINIMICTKFILSNTVCIVFRCAKFTNLHFKKWKWIQCWKFLFKLKNSSNIEKHFLGTLCHVTTNFHSMREILSTFYTISYKLFASWC
jgi:hypothetical protein